MRYLAATIFLAAMIAACTPNKRIISQASETPVPVTATPAPSSFEGDLQAMRNADFKFVLVFRRRDGAVMEAEDKSIINANTPPDANRRRLSDDGKAVIIGSNFPFLPGSIDTLTARYVMEDHSKADAGPLEVDRYAANANVNGKPAPKPAK